MRRTLPAREPRTSASRARQRVDSRAFELRVGSWPHGFRNAGTVPARGLCLYTPAGYEDYFRQVHEAVAAGAEATDALLTEFRSRFRTTAHPVG